MRRLNRTLSLFCLISASKKRLKAALIDLGSDTSVLKGLVPYMRRRMFELVLSMCSVVSVLSLFDPYMRINSLGCVHMIKQSWVTAVEG